VSKLRLHDVDDAERVVSTIVTRSGLRLSWHEREDLEQYLLTEIWELSLRYDPSRGISFGAWAVTTLRKRVIDHQRSKFRTVWKFKNSTYIRQRPEFVSLDAGDSERDRLGSAVASGSLEDAPSRVAEQLRRLESRACRPDGRNGGLGREAA
jgi:DNA-directed RNA polymerase specialized sigma24 family protein